MVQFTSGPDHNIPFRERGCLLHLTLQIFLLLFIIILCLILTPLVINSVTLAAQLFSGRELHSFFCIFLEKKKKSGLFRIAAMTNWINQAADATLHIDVDF